MRGVDIVDQCHVNYTAQIMSHKWWHRLLFFVLNTSLGNTFILYRHHQSLIDRGDGAKKQRAMTRSDFHCHIACWLTAPSLHVGRTSGSFNRSNRGIHESLSAGKQYRKCKLRGRKQNRYCPGVMVLSYV